MRAKTPRGRPDHPEPPLIRNRRRFLPYLGGIAALLLFAAALVILHSHAQAYRPSEVRRALRTLQAWQPFAALGLAATSYLLLTLYDVLGLRHIGRTTAVSSRRARLRHRICLQPHAWLRKSDRPLNALPNLHAYGTDRRRGRRNVGVRDRHFYDRACRGLSSGGAAGPVVSRSARNIAARGYRDRDAWVAVGGGLPRIRLVDRAADPIVRLRLHLPRPRTAARKSPFPSRTCRSLPLCSMSAYLMARPSGIVSSSRSSRLTARIEFGGPQICTAGHR
jgi:hypothetical protein